MADATQVKRRRGTDTQCLSMTPAEAEIIVDLTSDELRLGDGVTQGGILIPNYISARNRRYSRGTVGGTGNAITLTMSPVQTSYPTGLNLRLFATASNTGAVTIAVDGMSAKNVVKAEDGALVPLVAGDQVAGSSYDYDYDGTQFILLNPTTSGLSIVKQGDIDTSASIVSAFSFTNITLAGGQYGFFPQIRYTGSNGDAMVAFFGKAAAVSGNNVLGFEAVTTGGLTTSFATRIALGNAIGGPTLYAQQRYINNSPPYNLGDGDTAGFFFALVNSAGEIDASYLADAPPWAYNGPTDIGKCHICPVTKKPFKYVMDDLEAFMNDKRLKPKRVEITQEMKNRDMHLFPHPFTAHRPDLTPVLIDPMDYKVRRAIEFMDKGGTEEVANQIAAGKFQVESDTIRRKGPQGVPIHKMKYKFSKRI